MTLDRDFLKFNPPPHWMNRERPRVTINYLGVLYLNRKTFFEMGKPEAVRLYYNPSKHVIAVEKANVHSSDTIVVKPRNHNGAAIAIQPFCRHHRIAFTASETFNKPVIDAEGILLLDLKDTTRVGGWSRSADGKNREQRELERQAARVKRAEERHKRLLKQAQEKEARAREREMEKERRRIDKKNAAELTRREGAIERAREEYAERHAKHDR